MAKSFVVACRTFFGQLPQQSLKAFADDVKKLTDADKAELIPLLAAELGEEVTLTQPSA